MGCMPMVLSFSKLNNVLQMSGRALFGVLSNKKECCSRGIGGQERSHCFKIALSLLKCWSLQLQYMATVHGYWEKGRGWSCREAFKIFLIASSLMQIASLCVDPNSVEPNSFG